MKVCEAMARAVERNKHNCDVTDEDCNCKLCGPFYQYEGYELLDAEIYCADCYEYEVMTKTKNKRHALNAGGRFEQRAKGVRETLDGFEKLDAGNLSSHPRIGLCEIREGLANILDSLLPAGWKVETAGSHHLGNITITIVPTEPGSPVVLTLREPNTK